VCDASFISLVDILPSILECADTESNIILLYKPQFETPRNELSKSGVPKIAKNVEKRMQSFEEFLRENSCHIIAKKPSSLLGEK
jgi:predicted rRNA methylase YqxC with S4 and FtsJ domains